MSDAFWKIGHSLKICTSCHQPPLGHFVRVPSSGKRIIFEPREWEEQGTLSPEDFHREIRDVFSRNLPRHFNGRERVGMSLTGGLDTRMIMAWDKPAPDSLPCYTFGGTYRECRDVIVAREVARACGQSHPVIRCGPEFIVCFPYYAERTVYLTDGCAT